ncbi:MAG: hypothetical protein ACE5JO_13535 [Candidatus Binatia bacterium]
MQACRTLTVLVFGAAMGVTVSPSQAAGPDITITLSQETVGRFAQIVMPVTLRGTETVSVSAPILGTIQVNVAWVAVASNPKIAIKRDAATFDADVTVRASPLQYKDKVHGSLNATFDKRRNQVVIKVKQAFLNLRVQQAGVGTVTKVDVTDRLPNFEIPVAFPAPILKVGKRTVRVETDPKVIFGDGLVIITSKINFE